MRCSGRRKKTMYDPQGKTDNKLHPNSATIGNGKSEEWNGSAPKVLHMQLMGRDAALHLNRASQVIPPTDSPPPSTYTSLVKSDILDSATLLNVMDAGMIE
ncbi:hypothetical protein PKNA1_H1_1446150 [Plasmodium knowlesi strain H]|uniref:Uncharacterized protein n=1 Tax=Plasmodium knowlesi (strain H) TaxID=5851 RepID=A0A1A7VGK8_PLAKH|nr:hypothetical protein PKNA1_H1_1446150 [Plasmodium knowlesi strain H]